jgi:anthranilate/para-aminobenzoate synthase component I
VIPLFVEVLADTDTPLSLFLKLKDWGKYRALLESAEGGIKWGRFSFVALGSEGFEEAVLKAKEYIAQGDVIQVVLSQRFSRTFKGNAEDIYRVLRFLNPSPYMFYLARKKGHLRRQCGLCIL